MNRKPLLVVVGLILAFVVAILHFVVGWHHIPHHFQSLTSSLFHTESGEAAIVEEPIGVYGPDTLSATMAIREPFDTLYWGAQIRKGEFIPDDVKEAYTHFKGMDFNHLHKTDLKPTDLEAQQAIVHRYKQDMVALLRNNDAHIRIGTAFEAKLQPVEDNDPEIARVTAMVCAFDSKGNNLGNIQEPLYIVYDFVRFQSDPDTWYITDFSQTIPYDYNLFK
ncbi:hypothetical protein [Sphingobacterium tabacisoli]|uniref:Tim44-like domain-containing protein n=1 Tax=Sphingobacterium tabacisoli TaxID=2044855 RepID=A0ABW5L7F3_9SPHI|nr:hypothetical protein [Sphingobacterium tabacisoli]